MPRPSHATLVEKPVRSCPIPSTIISNPAVTAPSNAVLHVLAARRSSAGGSGMATGYTGRMSLGLLLVVLGIIALLVNTTVGLVLVLVGLILLVVPQLNRRA